MKILFISSKIQDKTSERSQNFARVLQQEHEVFFLNPTEHWIRKRSLWPLRALERLRIVKKLVQEGKSYRGVDLVFCKDSVYALPGFFIARHLKKPCVFESEGSMKAFWEKTHRYGPQVLPWIGLEKWLVKRVDYMITITEEDKQAYIGQGMEEARIHIIPHCIRLDTLSQKTKQEARAAHHLPQEETLFFFFSKFDYLPNKTALRFLSERLAPQLPGRLLLCGQGKLPRLHPKIHYLGFVPLKTLYDLIRASDVCLAPVFELKGSSTKALDMLAHGAPTVVTSVIQKGMPGLLDGLHALVADSEEAFVQKTLELAKNIPLQEKLKSPAQRLILENYDWKLFEKKLLGLIQEFGGGRQSQRKEDRI